VPNSHWPVDIPESESEALTTSAEMLLPVLAKCFSTFMQLHVIACERMPV